MLASLSVNVHLGRCHLAYDQVHIGGQGQLPENPNMQDSIKVLKHDDAGKY